MTVAESNGSVDLLIRTSKLLARMNRAQPESRASQTLYYQLLVNYFARIRDAHSLGKSIAAHTVFFPSEILYAMDIVPMHMETTAWLTALFLKEQPALLAKGAELGLSSEICSPHRCVAGIFGLNAITRPDVILWSNLICDNSAKSGELLMEISKSPGFFLDNPFQSSPGEVKYLTGELEDMVLFLEEKTGRKLDFNKLREIVDRTNHELEIYREIDEIRKAVPSPMPMTSYLSLLSADYLMPGQPESIEYLAQLRDELKSAAQQGKGAVTNERFRLL